MTKIEIKKAVKTAIAKLQDYVTSEFNKIRYEIIKMEKSDFNRGLIIFTNEEKLFSMNLEVVVGVEGIITYYAIYKDGTYSSPRFESISANEFVQHLGQILRIYNSMPNIKGEGF